MTSLWTQIASGLCWVFYGSFFEWYWHKFWMHTPRPPKEAFRGHTIVHHGRYKGDDSYFVPEGEHPEHILLKPYALPGIVVAHLPIILLINYLIPYTAIGAVVGIVLYFLVYEYMHWNMHVPRGHFVERFRWFQFLRKHHHLHHKYFQKNFCVLFPLADLVLGTLITERILAHRKAEREQAIANGVIAQERRKPRRADREARELVKTHLFGASSADRREKKIRAVRAMLKTVKNRNQP
ncbi:MAG TPA: sterol desaturase family protein [Chthonomonadaceae bacterium]|nr:sterol desaturase family protein [Chthonomonadaceae bacterium]